MAKLTFGIIGLGNFGGTVARDLTEYGNTVIGCDISEKVVSDHAETLTSAMIADARDDKALQEIGFADCDMALISIGDNFEASILAALNLKLLGVEKIWAKATSRTHHRILTKLGVDRVIHPEVEVGQRVAQVMHNPSVRDYISLGNGYYVVNFMVGDTLGGKDLSKLDILEKYDLKALSVMRGSKQIGSPEDDCTLEGDDVLVLLGKRKDLREFAASL